MQSSCFLKFWLYFCVTFITQGSCLSLFVPSPLLCRSGSHCAARFLLWAGVGIRVVLRVLYILGRPSTKDLQPLSSVLFISSILVPFSQHPFLLKWIVLRWAMSYLLMVCDLCKDDADKWRQCRSLFGTVQPTEIMLKTWREFQASVTWLTLSLMHVEAGLDPCGSSSSKPVFSPPDT